jgi:hypothetical protein
MSFLLADGGEQLLTWFNVILQGGAFALLTYIVIVMGPSTFRDNRIERETRDRRFEDIIRLMQERFAERSNQIVAAIEKQTALINQVNKEGAQRIESAVQVACKERRNQ